MSREQGSSTSTSTPSTRSMKSIARPMKAIAIIRQSKARDGSDSLGDQRARIEGYAAARGLEVVAFLGMAGESGARSLDKRDGLTEALERAERGEVQVIV